METTMEELKQLLSDHDLIVRIDERTAALGVTMEDVKKNYVTKEEFNPVKKLIYGLVALVLSGVVGAIIGLVINNPGL